MHERGRPLRLVAYSVMGAAAWATLLWDSVSASVKVLVLVVPPLLAGAYVWSRRPVVPKQP